MGLKFLGLRAVGLRVSWVKVVLGLGFPGFSGFRRVLGSNRWPDHGGYIGVISGTLWNPV